MSELSTGVIESLESRIHKALRLLVGLYEGHEGLPEAMQREADRQLRILAAHGGLDVSGYRAAVEITEHSEYDTKWVTRIVERSAVDRLGGLV